MLHDRGGRGAAQTAGGREGLVAAGPQALPGKDVAVITAGQTYRHHQGRTCRRGSLQSQAQLHEGLTGDSAEQHAPQPDRRQGNAVRTPARRGLPQELPGQHPAHGRGAGGQLAGRQRLRAAAFAAAASRARAASSSAGGMGRPGRRTHCEKQPSAGRRAAKAMGRAAGREASTASA